MTDTSKRLGYGGSAELFSTQVLITGGSFDTADAISYLNPLSIPSYSSPSNPSRSRVKHADGTSSYGGSLSFEVTASVLSNFLRTDRLLERHRLFDVAIDDGEDAYEMSDCKLVSFTMSGSPGGTINGQLSFMATAAESSSLTTANNFIRDSQPPLGYWYTGNTDVRDWTFTMSQDVTPVYINQNTTAPRYLKVGMVSYALQVTTYEGYIAHNVIKIATKTFTLTGDTTAQSYTFNGVTDLGMYSHSFETAADATVGSGDTIIT